MVPTQVSAVFHEDWFGDASCAALADQVARTAGVEGDIIEIGSWEGRSTVALANAAAPQQVYAIDTWQGSPGEVSAELAAERDVYAQFKANIAELTHGNVRPLRMPWRQFFTDRHCSIRLIFIDAEHTYLEVRDQIAAALPLLASGGVICGDDIHHPPVHQAVLEAFPDAQRIATLWCWQKP